MAFSVSPEKDTPREHYSVDDDGFETMKQSVTAFVGKCIVTIEADNFFCARGMVSEPYQSSVLENPTWGQLFECAKAAQKKTGDLHHTFFEGVSSKPDKTLIDGEEVTVLCLELGS